MPSSQAPTSTKEAAGFTLHTERLGPLPRSTTSSSASACTTPCRATSPRTLAAASPMPALGVLLRSIIVEREPIYRQHETVRLRRWFVRHQCPGDGAPERRPPQRAFDRLFDADRTALLTELVLAVGQRFGVRFEEFHNDSTSIASAAATTRPRPPDCSHRARDHLRAFEGAQAGPRATAVHSDHERRRQRAGGVSLHRRQHQRLGHPRADLGDAQGGGRQERLPVRGRQQTVFARTWITSTAQGRFVTVMPRSRFEDAQFRRMAANPHARVVPGVIGSNRATATGRATAGTSIGRLPPWKPGPSCGSGARC